MYTQGQSCNAGVVSLPNCLTLNTNGTSCATCADNFVLTKKGCVAGVKCDNFAIFQATSTVTYCLCQSSDKQSLRSAYHGDACLDGVVGPGCPDQLETSGNNCVCPSGTIWNPSKTQCL